MKINILNYRISFYISKLEKRTGVCSQIVNEDNHVLLWDFDDVSFNEIKKELYRIQKKYKLPTIYIITSSIGNYHAYSFTARPFRKIIHILSDTKNIDITYLRLGMVRGYYTLRISPRKYDSFRLVEILPSVIPDEVSPYNVTINEYFTANRGDKNAKR